MKILKNTFLLLTAILVSGFYFKAQGFPTPAPPDQVYTQQSAESASSPSEPQDFSTASPETAPSEPTACPTGGPFKTPMDVTPLPQNDTYPKGAGMIAKYNGYLTVILHPDTLHLTIKQNTNDYREVAGAPEWGDYSLDSTGNITFILYDPKYTPGSDPLYDGIWEHWNFYRFSDGSLKVYGMNQFNVARNGTTETEASIDCHGRITQGTVTVTKNGVVVSTDDLSEAP